jgi:hypothetical protein
MIFFGKILNTKTRLVWIFLKNTQYQDQAGMNFKKKTQYQDQAGMIFFEKYPKTKTRLVWI